MGIFSKNPRISFPVNMSPKVVTPEGGCTFCAPRASPPPSLPRQQAERCPSAVDLVG